MSIQACLDFLNFSDHIARTDCSSLKHDGKSARSGHHAVAGLPADRTIRMAFLSDLGDFQQGIADAQLRSNGEIVQYDALRQNIFRKGA